MEIETYIPHDHIVFTALDGGEGVLVDLNSKRYYVLNETAMLVWQSLEKQKPFPTLVEELTTVYEVTTEHASNSIRQLLEQFNSHQLLR